MKWKLHSLMNNSGMKITSVRYIEFNLNEIELSALCTDAIFLYCLSSVGSLRQLIPRFFFGERERACASSLAIFGTITHAPGMNLRPKVLERNGRVFTYTGT